MKILRGYKYRLYPTPEQQAVLRQMAGNCRFVWNKLLEAKNKCYAATQNFLWYKGFWTEIKRLRTQYPFLESIGNQSSLQQVGIHLDRALKNSKTSGYPQFKSKHKDPLRIPFSYVGSTSKNWIQVPKLRVEGLKPFRGAKVRWVKHRPMTGRPMSMVVSLDGDQWFVSILCEVNISDPVQSTKPPIGVDLGLDHFLTMNDGTKVDNPRFFKKTKKKLAREQRKLSRRIKNSKNYKKQRTKVTRIYRKIRRQRQDFLHKLSAQLIAKAGTVCIESLCVKDLTRGNLSRSVVDVGWGIFLGYLTYKSQQSGVKVQRISRWFPSSKTCSKCGWIKKDLTLRDRTWTCDQCGVKHDRDINAAINILNEGLRLQSTVGITGTHACGDTSTGDSMNEAESRQVSLKQEKEPTVLTVGTPFVEIN
jgi:putative transposase